MPGRVPVPPSFSCLLAAPLSCRPGGRGPVLYQPITMLDSMALRARSRSEPVSCMYSRMACTLSPAALARQSRAMLHGSPRRPVRPSAPLEMTHVSRSLGHADDRVARVGFCQHASGRLFIACPSDNNMCVGFDLEQRHVVLLLCWEQSGSGTGSCCRLSTELAGGRHKSAPLR